MRVRQVLYAALAGGVLPVAVACSGEDPPVTAGDSTPTGIATTAGPSPQAAPSYLTTGWPNTDFSRHTVEFDEIIQGCPGKDCIPALDAEGATSIPSAPGGQARFAPVGEVDYPGQVPVAYVNVGGIVRGYPLHILTWHEIVNDRFGDVPVVVTFCPLCNTALAFDRRVGEQVLDFGVSGNLRNSDLIMWDRQTESWWQQATGEGIVGELAGTFLTPVPVSVISYGDFVRAFPTAEVLTEDTGFARDYGINPYGGYDALGSTPFLFNGAIDPRLDGLERVVGLGSGDDSLAVPFAALVEHGVASVDVGGERFVVLWAPGTASALDDTVIATGEDVGASVAYVPAVGDQPLTFTQLEPGSFRDNETGSTWDVTGLATAGPLVGERMEVAVHTVHFWFAWAAFHAETEIWAP
ncbi:MAG: DUF3179 domain-containing protein [Dehalococcoidia bacterium]